MSIAPSKSPVDPRSQPARARAGAAPAASPQIDPVRVLRQNTWKLLASVVVGVVIGGVAHVVSDFVYPLYSDTVLFELQASPEEVTDVISQDQRTEESVERLGQTEAQRMVSREILLKAMNHRDIEQTKWSEWYLDDSGRFVAEDAVDDLEDELSASHRRKTNYVALSWSTHVASDLPVVLNRIADTYLATKKASDDQKFEANRGTFAKQLADLDSQLTSLGKEISKFVTDNNMTSTNEERNEMLLAVEDTARRIGETKSLLTLAASRKSQTEAKMEGRLEPSPDDIRTAEEDPQVQRANSSLQEMRVALETYRKKFGENHSALRGMERQVGAAAIERDAVLDQILKRNLNADFKTFADQVESYSGLLEKFEKDLAAMTVRLKDFTANLATVDELKERRERLLEARAKQLEVLANLDQVKAREDARAVSLARRSQTPREKSFPQIKYMLPVGGVLGLAIFTAFIFIRELLDTRVRYATDLTCVPGLRLLGSIPDLSEDPLGPKKVERVVREAPKSVVAELSRQIAGQILKACAQGSIKTVGCLSGLPEAGTTSFITNLADSMAASGRKVLVVDANFRRSHLAAAMGTEPDARGLGDVLRGTIAAGDVIRPAGGDVDIVPAGTPESRVFELLNTPALDAFFQAVSAQYDIVLVDLPPVVVAGDALAVANKVDGTVLVVRAFQEQRGLVSRVVSQLGDVRGQFIGAVLNRPINTAGGYLRKNYEAMAGYAGK
ncbi:MAG: GumC family protein [Phycisphaerales bacterium]